MMPIYKILYFHHAGGLGGATYSLAGLIKGLDPEIYASTVACIYPTPEITGFFRRQGIETVAAQGIREFGHTTGGWYPIYSPIGLKNLVNRIFRFWPSVRSTERLIRGLRPDIVHLNSLVLSPSAIGAKRAGVPLVWHVRESVVKGHMGIRKRLLGKLVEGFADEAVFISLNDQQLLVGGRKGVVIPNFVDFQCFDHTLDGKAVRDELGLLPEDKVILFMGARSVIKGIFPLLKAMPLVKKSVPAAQCIVAGGEYRFSGRLSSRIARVVFPIVGWGTVAQRVDNLMDHHSMHNYVHMLPWREDVERLIAACDVVVFPSVEPHFARPVIEAAAMAKPVVASRIGGVEELLEDNRTGILVEPGDVEKLAQALIRLLCDKSASRTMGQYALQRARISYDAANNIRIISGIYDNLLSKQGGG